MGVPPGRACAKQRGRLVPVPRLVALVPIEMAAMRRVQAPAGGAQISDQASSAGARPHRAKATSVRPG
jgi:hypothetical protein